MYVHVHMHVHVHVLIEHHLSAACCLLLYNQPANLQITVTYMYSCYVLVCTSCMYTIPSTLLTLITGTVAVAVDEKRANLMEFGRYVQEMLPKFVQHAQITHR